MIIPEYFRDKEVCCPCCGKRPDQVSLEMLYAFRILKGRPVVINSGARCEGHNKVIGGSPESTHLMGAFDIKTTKEDEYEDVRLLQLVGFTGIGINDNNFIHADRHHVTPAVWTY